VGKNKQKEGIVIGAGEQQRLEKTWSSDCCGNASRNTAVREEAGAGGGQSAEGRDFKALQKEVGRKGRSSRNEKRLGVCSINGRFAGGGRSTDCWWGTTSQVWRERTQSVTRDSCGRGEAGGESITWNCP